MKLDINYILYIYETLNKHEDIKRERLNKRET